MSEASLGDMRGSADDILTSASKSSAFGCSAMLVCSDDEEVRDGVSGGGGSEVGGCSGVQRMSEVCAMVRRTSEIAMKGSADDMLTLPSESSAFV